MKIVTRAQWGAKPPTRPHTIRGSVGLVFIHHTVTADIGDEAEEVRRIQAQHQADGSSDIDYGFLMGRTGTIFEGRGWGVTDGATGQDVDPSKPFDYYMSRELTMAFLGNYETLVPTPAQLDACREWIAESPDLTVGLVIRGHRDVRATACPGDHLYDDLDIIRVPWEDNMGDPNVEEERFGYRDAWNLMVSGDKTPGDYRTDDIASDDPVTRARAIGRRKAARDFSLIPPNPAP